MLRRLARIYPLYFVAVAITITFYILFPLRNDTGLSPTPFNILLNITMMQAWGYSQSFLAPAWSISTELAAYILFPFLLSQLILKSFRRSIFIGCGLFISILMLSLIPDSLIDMGKNGYSMGIWNERTFGPLLRCLLEFSLGIVTYRLYTKDDIIQKIQKPIASLISCILILSLLLIKNTDVLIIFLFPILILSLTNPEALISKILASWPIYSLGVISYSLYLIHLMTYFFKPEIMGFINEHHIPHNYLVTLIIQIIISVVVASFCYMLIEKPARKLLRNALEKA
jgi:peptidoglycan/LPS O-acetylase OafA/YrhL